MIFLTPQDFEQLIDLNQLAQVTGQSATVASKRSVPGVGGVDAQDVDWDVLARHEQAAIDHCKSAWRRVWDVDVIFTPLAERSENLPRPETAVRIATEKAILMAFKSRYFRGGLQANIPTLEKELEKKIQRIANMSERPDGFPAVDLREKEDDNLDNSAGVSFVSTDFDFDNRSPDE